LFYSFSVRLESNLSDYSAELEAFRADVAESNAKLERLEEKLQELEVQKQEASSAIDKAQRLIHVQKNSTHAEVFRLKGIFFNILEQDAY
jgi:predicted  nucleic acid-binding Zn-ribbon protein